MQTCTLYLVHAAHAQNHFLRGRWGGATDKARVAALIF